MLSEINQSKKKYNEWFNLYKVKEIGNSPIVTERRSMSSRRSRVREKQTESWGQFRFRGNVYVYYCDNGLHMLKLIKI